jgi:hypothetical protein
MHAAFELQPRPDTVGGVALARDGQRRVLVATQVRERLVEHRDRPAVALGVTDVHAGQIGGEQCGLFAALPRLDLEHDVVAIVWVPRGEKIAQLGFELVDRGLDPGYLGRKGFIVGAEFAGGLQVAAGGLQLAERRDDR